jgi:hypothetical protein
MNTLLAILLPVIVQVESGGDWDAVGAAGERGGLQITAVCVEDVNRIYGTAFGHTDAHDPKKAELIFNLYLRHYAAPSRLGREATLQDLARIWNGGPQGHRRNATVRYWRRVERLLY